MFNLLTLRKLQVYLNQDGDMQRTLDDVSLTLKPKETLVLVGESGCGKSMTAHAIMRLLPQSARIGLHSEINLEKASLLDLKEKIMESFRGQKISMIFQEPMTALNPVLTIGTQLAEAFLVHQSLTSSALQEKMIQILSDVDIANPKQRLHQYPHELSGGQRQRVLIAMALANQPEILIADEPTTALDVIVQNQILDLLKRLQAQYGMSLLLITHDLSIVKKMAHRVCVMYAGQIVEMANVDDFFKSPKHPYAKELLKSQPDFNKRGHYLDVIQGRVPAFSEMPGGCHFHPRCPARFEPCDHHAPTLIGDTHEVRCFLYDQSKHPQTVSVEDSKPKQLPHALKENRALPILKVRNLVVRFKTPKTHLLQKTAHEAVVNGVSFDLKKGKTTALVGESGCGKTTTSRAIMKLLPISSGEIFYNNQNISTLKGADLKAYRQKVQIIFQDAFASLDPKLTVKEILLEGLQHQPKSCRSPAHLIHLLDLVGLPQTSLNRYPHQFSGGQRSRIGLARALAPSPDIIICDEPTSALDVSVQAQILNLLKTLQLERGLSYLFITHNMAVVSYMADEVLVMKEGRVLEHGSCEHVLKTPKHPYTRELLDSVLLTT